jgi:hypothetical protein
MSDDILFVIPLVMPVTYYSGYDIDGVRDFINEHNQSLETYESDISDYHNPLTIDDFKFDTFSDKMHDKYGDKKIFILSFSHSSPYSLHYSVKYPDNVVGIICFPLRLYSQESHDRRIWKFKTNKGWENGPLSKYDVDRDWLEATDETLEKFRHNMGEIEHEATYSIFDLHLQKQWNEIPSKFKVPTYLFSRLDMDVDSIIKLNFERKDVAAMKSIMSENDALLNSAMWNFDRVKLDARLLKENEGGDLRIHHIIGRIHTTSVVVDALKIMLTDLFSDCRMKYHKYKAKYLDTANESSSE